MLLQEADSGLPSSFCWYRTAMESKIDVIIIDGAGVLATFLVLLQRHQPTAAPSLNSQVDKSGICVHVKTIRLNGPSVILPSADCRLL